MYEELRAIETALHTTIRLALIVNYGGEDTEWWREGVPEGIRKKCAVRQQEDPIPIDTLFRYTDVLDLREILEKRWGEIHGLIGRLATDKKKLLADLLRFNEIRKMVMHPVRGAVPDDADFEFIKDLKRRLEKVFLIEDLIGRLSTQAAEGAASVQGPSTP
jgi:hypothetical protein